ncbi:MAG: flagellar hook-length control protein FliK [Spirochaetales bacterium]|nr:flagellar hook-length control protein FliK [Spirochaetales bacterium]
MAQPAVINSIPSQKSASNAAEAGKKQNGITGKKGIISKFARLMKNRIGLFRNKEAGNLGKLKDNLARLRELLKSLSHGKIREQVEGFLKQLAMDKNFHQDNKTDKIRDFLKKLKESFKNLKDKDLKELHALLEQFTGMLKSRDNLKDINALLHEKKDSDSRPEQKAKVTVIDLRKKGQANLNQLDNARSSMHIKTANSGNEATVKSPDSVQNGIFMETKEGIKTNLKDNITRSSDFESRLREALRNETLKQTQIILKDGGKGEIRLVLKPDNLGNVRIRINLENNHLAGKIFVENNSVKDVFNSLLGDLSTALKDKGFDSVALQVSVGNQQQEQQNGEESDSFFPYSALERLSGFENNQEFIDDYTGEDSLINLVV